MCCCRCTPTSTASSGSRRSRRGCASGSLAAHGSPRSSLATPTRSPTARVHFGYRDGIAQPEIRGAPWPPLARHAAGRRDRRLPARPRLREPLRRQLPRQPAARARRQRDAMARSGSCARTCAGSKRCSGRGRTGSRSDRELVAAKLMGSWRNGVPLMLSPDAARARSADPTRPTSTTSTTPPAAGHPDLLRRLRRSALPRRRPHPPAEPARLAGRWAAPQPPARPPRHALRSALRSRQARRRGRAGADRAVPVRRSRAPVRVHPAGVGQPGPLDARPAWHPRSDPRRPAQRRWQVRVADLGLA